MTTVPRSRRSSTRALLAAGCALVALLTAATPGAAQERGHAVRQSSGAEREWTAERMRRAIPLPLPAPVRAAALAPLPAAALPPAYDYPPPYSRWEHFKDGYDNFPYRAVGKLFFSQGAGDYVCSAASVGNAAILTAGHCIHAGDGSAGGWSYDLLFVPAYRDGAAPYGRWRASSVQTTPQWFAGGAAGDYQHDLGGAVLRLRNGVSVSQAVGAVAPVFNLDPRQHWMSLSYPAGFPFGGQRMIVCAGSWAYGDGSYAGEPYPVGMGCDVTGGASGGPWIVGFRGGSRVNGVVSYRYDRAGEVFSPYFGEDAEAFSADLIATSP